MVVRWASATKRCFTVGHEDFGTWHGSTAWTTSICTTEYIDEA